MKQKRKASTVGVFGWRHGQLLEAAAHPCDPKRDDNPAQPQLR